MKQVSDNKNLNYVYPIWNGETMILVSDQADNNYTKLVYYKGTFKRPIITKIIDVNTPNNFYKNQLLVEALDYGSIGFDAVEIINAVKGEEILTVRTRDDFESHRSKRAKQKSQGNGKSYSYLFDGAKGESDADDSGSVKLQKIGKIS